MSAAGRRGSDPQVRPTRLLSRGRILLGLILLGLVVPPVAGVYLTRFFLLGDQDYSREALERRPHLDPAALAATVISGIVSAHAYFTGFTLTGISSVEALVLAGVLIYGFDAVLGRRKGTSA